MVPRAYASDDAPSRLWVAGFTAKLRQQIIIDASHLQTLLNKQITAISFRRDTGNGKAFSGGRATLGVRVSTSRNDPLSASPVFSANTGPDEILVFNQQVIVPTSPATTGSVAWDSTNSVRLAFSAAFRYSGGDLCIDIEGTPDPSMKVDWWPVDAAYDMASGTVVSKGNACGTYTNGTSGTSFAAGSSLVPGSSANFFMQGTPGSPVGMVIALRTQINRLNLSVIGSSTNCYLHVDQILDAITTFVGPMTEPLVSSMGGRAHVLLQIPNNTGILGARFATQWFELLPNLTSSNALDCTISSQVPSLGMSVVVAGADSTGVIPNTGIVDAGTAHVVKLEYQ